ncbi:ISNCY family transposase [Gloeothece verrucosa]|uniref:Transposase n=1 Tax=Gloeothece verrucosa (strain PCC 7822) TaxID=497965 RepID=E0UN08_GLOV7|nr:ISNCY family transposase [Gloeothece verrucosa]ADN18338.1 transposase [Gloeothece verrucosa PCC 7822]
MEILPVTISPSELIEFLFLQLDNLPDERKGLNKTYEIRDMVIAAFSVFFTQCPSFLEHQSLMKKRRGKDNALSLFGLKKIPCDNQIRNLLDRIPATRVFEPFQTVWEWLKKNQILNHFKYLDEEILLALDGTEYYSSKKMNCLHCNCRHHRNGTTTYYHQVITPVIVAPDKKQVINLEPEFIRKQDGETKQDCENAAIKRWLLKNPASKKNQKITLLGDDLYSRQPICELAIEQGYNFIFVALASSHKSLYEWLEFLEKNKKIIKGQVRKYQKNKLLYYKYKYVNNVPLRETEPSLIVNWYEVEIYDKGKEKVIYQNSFITNHQLNDERMEKIITSGRTRWKIENEGNNLLKNQGYNLEHNFGHGKENLSEILLALNLLSFLFHNVLELVNELYQKARSKLEKRKTFFNDIRALVKYEWFEDWSELFVYIISEGEQKRLINTS